MKQLSVFLMLLFLLSCSSEFDEFDDVKTELEQLNEDDNYPRSKFDNLVLKHGSKIVPFLVKELDNSDYNQKTLTKLIESVIKVYDENTLPYMNSQKEEKFTREYLAVFMTVLFHEEIHHKTKMLDNSFLWKLIRFVDDESEGYVGTEFSTLGALNLLIFDISSNKFFSQMIISGEYDVPELKNIFAKWYSSNQNKIVWSPEKSVFVIKH